MTTSLIFALAAAPSGISLSLANPMMNAADLLSLAFALGVALWTFHQYGRPRRFIELPTARIEPEFDGRGDDPGERGVYRDAA